ncbi:MAG TPA: PHB depolymerase family esterase [Fibrobacteria bacterium]|nr:PHB depolymerase family esterase [Fibrobacteria bacterium]HOX52978.1 PHB depolymerase family esterase [Fibrobacteria bacterium]
MSKFWSKSLAVGLVCGAVAEAQTWTFQVGGVERTAIVYAPKDLGANRPLFLSMHGLSGDASMQKMMARVESIADTAKFLLVYPNGLDKQWDISGTTDIEFLLKIIDSTASRYGIDRSRVYSSGFSMGGMMSYHLACKNPDKVAAIGAGAGYPLGGQYGCAKTRPVPILHIHGELDTFVAFKGIRPFLAKKATEYGCSTLTDTTRPYPASKPSSKVTREHWGPCDKSGRKSEITLMTIADMSHNYVTGPHINMSEEIWNFVKEWSLGQSGVLPAGKSRRFGVSMRIVSGKAQVTSTAGLARVVVRDLEGREVARWTAPQETRVFEVSLPVSQAPQGVLAVEVVDGMGIAGGMVALPR